MITRYAAHRVYGLAAEQPRLVVCRPDSRLGSAAVAARRAKKKRLRQRKKRSR